MDYRTNLSPSHGQGSLGDAARIAQLTLPLRPRLPAWIAIHELGCDRLQLVSPNLSYTLTHPLFIEIFHALQPLLTGVAATEQLVEAVAGVAEPSTTLFLLKSLFANGIIYEGDLSRYPPSDLVTDRRAHADFFACFTSDPASALAHVATAEILLAMPDQLAKMLQADLESFGFSPPQRMDTSAAGFVCELDVHLNCCEPQAKPLLIAALDATERRLFSQINRVCLRHDTRWLHIESEGPRITLGPCIVPFETACYTCYSFRQASHLPYRINPDDDIEFVSHAEHGRTFSPLWRLALAQVAIECVRLKTGFSSPTTLGRCHEIISTHVSAHSIEVLKLPRCPSCGVPYAVEESFTTPAKKRRATPLI